MKNDLFELNKQLEEKYQQKLSYDLDFHQQASYFPIESTAIQRWFRIRESSSLEWSEYFVERLAKKVDCIIDPFCGAGTTSLASTKYDVPFIGVELRSSLVVVGYAKTQAFDSNIKNVENLIDICYKYLAEYMTTHEIISIDELFQTLLDSLLDYDYPIPDLLILWTIMLSCVTRICESEIKVLELMNAFKIDAANILEDLKSIEYQKKKSNSLLLNGDSKQVQWGEAVNHLGIATPCNILLLTSPTFVNTAQEKNIIFETLDEFSKRFIVKLKLGMEAYFSAPEIAKLPDQFRFSSEIDWFLDLFYSVLVKIKQVMKKGSKLIIENENGSLNDQDLLTDYYISELAEHVGFQVDKIVVTHYIVEPGTISKNDTGKRGSIIYLTF